MSVLAISTWSSNADAGGFYSGVKGARAAGRGGAFVAKADDLSAVGLNPAGLAKTDTTYIHIGNRFSLNQNTFTRAPTLDWGNTTNGVPPYVEFDSVSTDVPFQPLDPIIGVATNFGLPDWGFAVAAYSPPGVSRQEYPVDGGQRYMMVSRNAMLINYAASVAWKPSENFGIGVTFQNLAVPLLEYSLVIDANPEQGSANPVSSQYDMLATISGSDYFTPQAIVGAWFKPARYLEVGVSGQVIPAQIETDSTISIDPLDQNIIDRIEQTDDRIVLLRGLQEADDVKLTLPLPLTARAGVRYIGFEGDRELYDIELDVTYETWSRVESFEVDSNGIVAELFNEPIPIGVVNVEKQWQDTIGVHLGGDYAIAPELLTLRAGVYYETPTAKPAYAHVDFPTGEQLGASIGTSINAGPLEIALVYEYRHQPEIKVTEGEARFTQEASGSQCEPPYQDTSVCAEPYLGQRAPYVNAGSYQAHTHAASLDLLYRF